MIFSWRSAATRAPARGLTSCWALGLALGFGLAGAVPGSSAWALQTAELKELEELLHDLGFDPGPVDGTVDAATIDAIRRYQEFAALPGDPEPSARLLDELRGVAAAFAALNAGKEKAAASELPDLGSGTAPEDSAPPEAEPGAVVEKVVVPPPPAPPKLSAPEELAPQIAGNPTAESQAAEKETAAEDNNETPAPPQVAALPPAEEAAPPAMPAPPVEAVEPVDEAQARIDAELAPYRQQLADGSLSREALARQFNDEGRKLLQQAHYEEAIVKFSVAIQLDPNFAGAYSNRGTAYQLQDEGELAKADFDRSKQLGFGGARLGDSANPLK